MKKNVFINGVILITCLCISFIFQITEVFAQQNKIDSLLMLVKTDKEDTNKVFHLNELGWDYCYRAPDTAIIYSQQALNLSEKLNWQIGIAVSYTHLGFAYRNKGNFPKSLQYNEKAIEIWDLLENNPGKNNISKIKIKKAYTLGNIGMVYNDQGNYPRALEYHFKALKIQEEAGNKNGIATNYGNIGIVFFEEEDYTHSTYYYSKALKEFEELGDKNSIAGCLTNIGINLSKQNDFAKSYYFLFKALKISEEIGNEIVIANILSNIGNNYSEQKNYVEALEYYQKTLKIEEKTGDQYEIAEILGNIGSLYTNTKKYAEAEKYLLKALNISENLGVFDLQKDHQNYLFELYNRTGNYKKALDHYQKSMIAKDSLYNEDKAKEITKKEMNYEFDKKEAATKAEQDKKVILANAEIKRQTLIKNSTLGGVGVVGFFSFLLVLSVNRRRKTAFDKQVSDVEMKALRAQMNPHFIFNCMNSIDDYILNNDINNSSLYVNKFSRLMRLILESSRKDEISIKEDIETLELYVQLENLRMLNKVECTFTISPEINVEDTLIPPMLLQPFIENAFKHAFDEIEHPKLEIQISLKDEMLYCSVTDNGKGRNKEQKVVTEGKEKRTSLAMTVTQERLDIISKIKKSKAYMAFEDLKDSYQKAAGTKVELAIPASYAF